MRNTPTCVGKTLSNDKFKWKQEKHPHVCGEDEFATADIAVAEETPPRVWGRLTSAASKTNMVGNTPTCVGKTH